MVIVTKNNLRILAISDVQGNLDAFNELYEREGSNIDIIIHTGNFGFWDRETINSDKDNTFLKQIVAFSEVLHKDVVQQLNDLSIIASTNSSSASSSAAASDALKSKLLEENHALSQLDAYVSGSKALPCPVYTIFGPLDDPRVINKFQKDEYHINNLFLIDHTRYYEIESPLADQPNIKLYGLGGTLKIHSLFDHGSLSEEYDELCGKTGDLWVSMIQIATMYQKVMKHADETAKNNSDSSINIFVAHSPVVKTPLLEHLSILTNADFTISQGLHFRYPVMGNGMSFVDSMGGSAGYIESYRSKFSRLRMILGELWLIVKDNLLELLEDYPERDDTDGGSDSTSTHIEGYGQALELGLSLFDKIPVSINDSTEKIVPLTLKTEVPERATGGDDKDDSDTNKKVLKKINDMYFSAYYNLWHFNLCDLITRQPNSDIQSDYNIMIFNLDEEGDFKLDFCSSQGFNFKFKVEAVESSLLADAKGDNSEVEEDAEAEAEGEVGVETGHEAEGDVSVEGDELSEGLDPDTYNDEGNDGGAYDPDATNNEDDTSDSDGIDSTNKKGNYRGSKFIPNFRGRGGRGSRGSRGSGYRGRGGSRGKPRGGGRGK